jgi:SdpI/YfhL protein family
MRLLNDVAVVGFVLAVASVPFIFGLVPRNRLYGFRVAATLRDDHVWYVTNRRMGREGVMMGLGLWALAEAFERSTLNPETATSVATGLMVVAVVVFIIRGWKFANRVAKQAAGK